MIYRERILKDSPYVNKKSYAPLWGAIVLFAMLNCNSLRAQQSEDPFDTTVADDSPAEEATPEPTPSDKTIIKVPVPEEVSTPAEENNDDSLLLAQPEPTPTPSGNVSEEELLSNQVSSKKAKTENNDSSSEIQDLSLEEAHEIQSAKNPKKKKSRSAKINKVDNGALNSFDMESVGKSRKSRVRQSQEQMAPVKIYGRDSKTGMRNEINTQNDGSRYSLVYHANANLKRAQDVTTLEFLYGYKLNNRKVPLWAEFCIFKTTAQFDTVAIPNNNMVVANRTNLDASSESIFGIGAGISMRSNWIQDFIDTEKWSESTSAQFYYLTMSEEYFSKSYKGYGIKAHFSLNYRMSQSVQIGPKFGHYLASVTRAAENSEPSDKRSLLLTWTSLGFDFTYYFK